MWKSLTAVVLDADEPSAGRGARSPGVPGRTIILAGQERYVRGQAPPDSRLAVAVLQCGHFPGPSCCDDEDGNGEGATLDVSGDAEGDTTLEPEAVDVEEPAEA